eukprot:414570_1
MVLLFTISLLLITTQSQTQWCIWGKRGTMNVGINGLYIYDADYPSTNGYPSFVKTIGATCSTPSIALWYTGSAWRLSVAKGDTGGFGVCVQSSLSNCGVGQWDTGNENVFAQAGSCPEWPCSSVSSTFPIYGCDGPFTTDVGVNAWSNAAADRFLFFVPHVFQWFCDSVLDQISCPSYGYAYSEQGWELISTGDSSTSTWDYVDQAGDAATASTTLTCTGSPVSSPTADPVTPFPTNDPGTNPTIGIPTLQPTESVPSNALASICVWGRQAPQPDFWNNLVNGQYYYDGEFNSASSWKKVSHSACSGEKYLYKEGLYDRWAIAGSKGSSQYYAYCEYPEITSCIANKWTVNEQGDTWTIDSTMRALSGDCPSWNCDTIDTNAPGTNANCNQFTTQLGANAYKSASGYVWYFNPLYFGWFCIDNTQYDFADCSASYQLSTTGWSDLASGDTTSLDIDFVSGSDQTTLSVTCTGTGTLTNAPTNPPTGVRSDNPTKTPTAYPTRDPTKNPSKQPTSPTAANPATTSDPSQNPTLNPTSNPVTDPVGNPVSSPVDNPVTNPVDDPTNNPTLNPSLTPTIDTDTEWSCVRLSNLDQDNLNAYWRKFGISGTHSAYHFGGYWMYFVDGDSDERWYIGILKGSSDSNNIFAYCLMEDISQCTGAWYVWSDATSEFVQDTDSTVVNCDTTQSPTSDNQGDDDDDDDDGNENSAINKGEMWWIYVIANVMVSCQLL